MGFELPLPSSEVSGWCRLGWRLRLYRCVWCSIYVFFLVRWSFCGFPWAAKDRERSAKGIARGWFSGKGILDNPHIYPLIREYILNHMGGP